MDFVLTRSNQDLRAISRPTIDAILDLAKCTIISTMSNAHFDAYVLSESSLFIYSKKVIIKTCGTTRLLRAMIPFIDAAKTVGAVLDFLQFSRSNFMFPHKQKYPHRGFSEETEYLNKQLQTKGQAQVLGSVNGPRWHLYVADYNLAKQETFTQQSLEIIMFNLDPEVMKTFYKAAEAESEEKMKCASANKIDKKIGEPTNDGNEATVVSGIDTFLPGSSIDSFLFNPCGYSCNGLLDDAYFTIHITPEPQCSFVSFETNANHADYTKLVEKVVNTFKPAVFCVSILADDNSAIRDSRKGINWDLSGFTHTGIAHHDFPNGYNASAAQYVSDKPPAYAQHPMQMAELKELYETAASGVEWSKYQGLLDKATRVSSLNTKLADRIGRLENELSNTKTQLGDVLADNAKLRDALRLLLTDMQPMKANGAFDEGVFQMLAAGK